MPGPAHRMEIASSSVLPRLLWLLLSSPWDPLRRLVRTLRRVRTGQCSKLRPAMATRISRNAPNFSTTTTSTASSTPSSPTRFRVILGHLGTSLEEEAEALLLGPEAPQLLEGAPEAPAPAGELAIMRWPPRDTWGQDLSLLRRACLVLLGAEAWDRDLMRPGPPPPAAARRGDGPEEQRACADQPAAEACQPQRRGAVVAGPLSRPGPPEEEGEEGQDPFPSGSGWFAAV
ncbi:unnamed protein product [Prorocentrum cordatum]|uniref:Uncharacterized protein n=1 Tax=Prorocentrum cordatum TaxID=2364126 RepID=A0ABN9RGQ9_9DINO|nr:unnamed protein product [Polarella glacialis]